MTEALNVQDNMPREASSGAASVSPLARKVAFVPTLSLSAGGGQPPIDLKLRARWASLRGVLRSLLQCAEQLLMFKIAAQRDGSLELGSSRLRPVAPALEAARGATQRVWRTQ